MKFPQVIVCAFDDWNANQLRPLVGERRCVLKEVRQASAVPELLRTGRPSVVVIQADPTAEQPHALQLCGDIQCQFPDVAVVVMSDMKLSEPERMRWSADVYSLGARYVLFPPLTRAILEDVVDGLLVAVWWRTTGLELKRQPRAVAEIDLAAGDYDESESS
jgi:hypothetical protein